MVSLPRTAILAAFLAVLATCTKAAETGWGYYGGDQGGQRYSSATQITPANVAQLKEAWRYSTGDVASKGDAMAHASFEDTPILADGRLYVCSPFDEVSALDPGTGRQLWRYDPKIDPDLFYANDDICRGVASWRVPNAQGVCAARIYLATKDRRLIALDAATGRPCAGFGKGGTIDIPIENYVGARPAAYTTTADEAEVRRLYQIPGNIHLPKSVALSRVLTIKVMHAKDGSVVGWYRRGGIGSTSAPLVSHGIVVVGSSIDDNQRVDEIRGTVEAYDAITGAPKWSWDPLGDQKPPFRGGAANVWAPMSADDARGLIYLPVTSASPDFWGGYRKGTGGYANSVTALAVETGKPVWSFQTTHHDLWDYDVPAQPTLGMVTYKGVTAPAVLQATKQALLFTLNAETGKPIIPVEERKVPQGGVPGEQVWPTQPFPVAPKPLAPSTIKPDDAYGLMFWGRGACHDKIAAARADGLYTPPSTQGTIVYPFAGGGSNWGGIAFDPVHQIVYANVSSAMHLVTLIPRQDVMAARAKFPGQEVSPNLGAPFAMMREVVLSPFGIPCNPPPWGMLHAIDMHSGRILWTVPLGTLSNWLPLDYLLGKTGTPNEGGPIVTASGLLFIGATMDRDFRALDARTGAELWRTQLPAGGQATPMTYVWKGRQYVVIAAGGHSKSNTPRGDQVVAFALPE